MNQAVTTKAQTSQPLAMPIRNYSEFYRFYLTEHSNVMSRRLHVAGSLAGLYGIYKAIKTGKKSYLLKGIATGYACAWVGHFFFEKNKPASFKQPVYSFMSDWRMLADVCRGKVSLRHARYDKQ
ncbi:Mpo1-like protein [Alkanindiges sp. WGS2144]|uniref:Mpo1-like protein n=1 Tax=Alkanindiges sp. WGS2144 TaxID=3366808 RepID=UPI003750A5D3